jgi:HD domain-containing protein
MSDHNRWKARPLGSVLLRAIIVLIPVLCGFGAALLVGRALGPPAEALDAVFWWAIVLGASLAVVFLAERTVRRLGPLAVLLRLTMVFPDRAPSRFAVARQGGNVRNLMDRLERARARGEEETGRAAEIILALAAALAAHDRFTRGHSERTRVFTDMLAEELKVPGPDRDRLRWAALLHDIGKLSVPPRVLNKKDPLVAGEWDTLHRHPEEGMRLISPLVPWLGPWAEAVAQHHEWYNGKGYPEGLTGERIFFGARIVSVADAFDTMTSARAYRKPLSAEAARREVAKHAGGQFDPGVVRALLNLSIGRLWWRLGVLSWFAQIPVVGRLSGLPAQVASAQQTAASAATVAAAATTLGVVGVISPTALLAEAGSPSARNAPAPAAEVAAATEPIFQSPPELGADGPHGPGARPDHHRGKHRRGTDHRGKGTGKAHGHGGDQTTTDHPSGSDHAGGASGSAGTGGNAGGGGVGPDQGTGSATSEAAPVTPPVETGQTNGNH